MTKIKCIEIQTDQFVQIQFYLGQRERNDYFLYLNLLIFFFPLIKKVPVVFYHSPLPAHMSLCVVVDGPASK